MMDGMIRIVVIEIDKVLNAEVYDEVVLPVNEASNFVKKYSDMKKYRVQNIIALQR